MKNRPVNRLIHCWAAYLYVFLVSRQMNYTKFLASYEARSPFVQWKGNLNGTLWHFLHLEGIIEGHLSCLSTTEAYPSGYLCGMFSNIGAPYGDCNFYCYGIFFFFYYLTFILPVIFPLRFKIFFCKGDLAKSKAADAHRYWYERGRQYI